MNMMRIFYIGLSGVGMMFSSMASGNDAGGLQSPACGVVCDPYKLCRDDRYFGVDGKRSGKINQTTTKMLFMCRE